MVLNVRDVVGRCPRCHHQAPNPTGCAHCNPDELGRKLLAANTEIARLRGEKRFYLLVRVRAVKHLRPCTKDGAALVSRPMIDAYQPLWWRVADHRGDADTVADGQYTLTIAEVTCATLEHARDYFKACMTFYRPLLDGLPNTAPEDWPAPMDTDQHDEHMANYFMDRIVARREGKPIPHTLKRCDCELNAGQKAPKQIEPVRCNRMFMVTIDHGGFDLDHPQTCNLPAGHSGPHSGT